MQVNRRMRNRSCRSGLRGNGLFGTIPTMSRHRMFPTVLSTCVILLSLTGVEVLHAQTARGPAKSVAAATPVRLGSFYTDAQAERGNKIFSANCLACHGRKDMSSADFRLRWNGRTVFDLLDRIESSMPENDPGSLSSAEYSDVVAYLLKLNGMPAGKSPVAPGPSLKQQKLAFPSH